MEQETVLEIKDLEVAFMVRGKKLKPIRKASLNLYKGETLVIVGESGSGKSVMSKSVMGMLDKNGFIESGSIIFGGIDIAKYKTEEEWLKIRGKKIAMIMQDPMTSLNPLKTIGKQIQETIELHSRLNKAEARAATYELIEKVGISEPERRYKQYPHELSGGLRQRVVIAIACACHPDILICDEPTTALDVTVQNQILKLIKDMKDEYKMSVIFITHDLGVVANVADRIAVMYAGQIVEYGLSEEIFYDPKHAYTWALLSALPQLGEKGKHLPSIDGTPPNLYNEIKGDAFAPRNRQAMYIDYEEEPPLFKVTDTHYAKTWYLDERCCDVVRPAILENYREKMAEVSKGRF